MLTRQQKTQLINSGQKLLKESQVLIFVDFSGTNVSEISALRKILKGIGAKFKVIKKRLLRIIFEKEGINFNPEQFDSQVGTIFVNRDISEIASPVYKFFKETEKKGFKILGSYDLADKNFLDSETVKKIGQLPPREILLGQLIGMLAAPIRMFLYVLNEKSKMVEK